MTQKHTPKPGKPVTTTHQFAIFGPESDVMQFVESIRHGSKASKDLLDSRFWLAKHLGITADTPEFGYGLKVWTEHPANRWVADLIRSKVHPTLKFSLLYMNETHVGAVDNMKGELIEFRWNTADVSKAFLNGPLFHDRNLHNTPEEQDDVDTMAFAVEGLYNMNQEDLDDFLSRL